MAGPIKVEAYECSKCKRVIYGPLEKVEEIREEAQRHFDVPVSRALPVGLVLSKGNINSHDIIVDNTGICQDNHQVFHKIYSFISGRVITPHLTKEPCLTQNFPYGYIYSFISGCVIKEPCLTQNFPYNYEMIVTELKEGRLKFLTEDELRKVEEAHRASTSGIYSMFPNIELKRTDEGLEQLVAE